MAALLFEVATDAADVGGVVAVSTDEDDVGVDLVGRLDDALVGVAPPEFTSGTLNLNGEYTASVTATAEGESRSRYCAR